MNRYVVLLVLSACALDEVPDESMIEQQSVPTSLQGTPGQGTSAQGTSAQGTSAQGASLQGTSAQGTSAQGATFGGAPAYYATVDGTALIFWRRLGSLKTTTGWEQRFPNKICYWNATRTAMTQPCTKAPLSSSPLLGSRWPTTFTRRETDGSITTIPVTLEIKAVRSDPTTAMFALYGSDYAKAATVACENPDRCRPNSDIFNYDVQMIDVFDSNGQPEWLCPAGQTAIALAGTWNSSTWYYSPSSSQFTFACTNGVIAKCTRWGYRPYDRAIRDNDPGNVKLALAGYHQSCIRAAAADYCGIAKSMTKNGTLVDVYDYTAAWEAGFIPKTDGLVYPDFNTVSAFAMEAWFDNDGAAAVDRTRYAELSANPNWSIDATCPTKFYASTEFAPYNKVAPQNGPIVYIDSSTGCAHSELVVGKYLAPDCSYCTSHVPAECNDPAHGWDQSCVEFAKASMDSPWGPCHAVENRMTYPHGECTRGVALNKYDSGCTLAVCLSNPGCCDPAVGWTEACVMAANSTCQGGQENLFQGFCGPISSLSQVW